MARLGIARLKPECIYPTVELVQQATGGDAVSLVNYPSCQSNMTYKVVTFLGSVSLLMPLHIETCLGCLMRDCLFEQEGICNKLSDWFGRQFSWLRQCVGDPGDGGMYTLNAIPFSCAAIHFPKGQFLSDNDIWCRRLRIFRVGKRVGSGFLLVNSYIISLPIQN